MKKLKLWFTHFWGKFDCNDNIFTHILSKNYDIIITPNNPDLVITGHYLERYQNAKMVYFSGEPFYDIGVNDYALTGFYVDDPRFFRVPLYLLYAYDYYKLGFTKSYDAILNKSNFKLYNKTDFCNYISRGGNPRRNEFFQKLSEYKKVNSLGSHLNNGPLVPGESGTIEGSIFKCKLQRQYKFSMSFENFSDPIPPCGYMTEKIFEPMIAMSIPIYWGNPSVYKDFNTNSFINWLDYGSDEKVIERIIEIDNDDDLYMDYIKENYVVNQYLLSIDYLVDIFDKILN